LLDFSLHLVASIITTLNKCLDFFKTSKHREQTRNGGRVNHDFTAQKILFEAALYPGRS
jgi:hypothetical protein